MTNFKVGDKVRITEGPHNGFLLEGGAVGRLGVVTDAGSAYGNVEVEFEGDNIDGVNIWWFHATGLELVDEAVSHPSHYSAGMPEGVEVIDIIRSQGGSWEFSNAIKYLLRAQYKGSYEQDLRKAIQYLTWEVEK